MDTALQSTGAVAELAATRKQEKYIPLLNSHIFEPLAFETNGAVIESAQKFISDLHHRISSSSNDCRGTVYLFQNVSVIIQGFNVVLIYKSFDAEDPNI
jgi:hypothetical protein